MNENIKMESVDGQEKMKKFYGEVTVKIPVEVVLPAFADDDMIKDIMVDEALDELSGSSPSIEEIEAEILDEEDVK